MQAENLLEKQHWDVNINHLDLRGGVLFSLKPLALLLRFHYPEKFECNLMRL